MSQRAVVGAVLCAGFGTRLRPLTEALPKPLVPFLNTPLVTYALDHLSRAGIERVGLNLHHLADSIPPVVDRIGGRFGLEPVYTREWDILGTAGGVRGIWEALGEPDATMVVLNGDSIMNIDLAEHLQAHRESGRPASLVVRPKADDQPGGVWLDDGRLAGLRDMRHPEAGDDLAQYDFTGVHFLEPELLADIPLEEGCMVGDVYGPALEDGEDFHCSVNDDFWAALDNPRLHLATSRRVLSDPDLFAQAPLPEALDEGFFGFDGDIFDEADIDHTAPALVGPNVEIGEGVKLGPNAIIDGVELEDGAVVENAIIYGMGSIEGEWRDCMAVAGKVARLDE